MSTRQIDQWNDDFEVGGGHLYAPGSAAIVRQVRYRLEGRRGRYAPCVAGDLGATFMLQRMNGAWLEIAVDTCTRTDDGREHAQFTAV